MRLLYQTRTYFQNNDQNWTDTNRSVLPQSHQCRRYHSGTVSSAPLRTLSPSRRVGGFALGKTTIKSRAKNLPYHLMCPNRARKMSPQKSWKEVFCFGTFSLSFFLGRRCTLLPRRLYISALIVCWSLHNPPCGALHRFTVSPPHTGGSLVASPPARCRHCSLVLFSNLYGRIAAKIVSA